MNIGSLIRAIDRRGPRRRTPCAVLRALAEHVDNHGVCFPGHARLAAKCRLTPRSVLAALAWLEEDGWIDIERGAGMAGKKGRGRTNRYRLNLARLGCKPFSESASPEIPSQENASPETSSSGKSCASPVKPRGKPVDASLSSEKASCEIHCIPPAPLNRKKVRTKYLKATAKEEAKARDDSPIAKMQLRQKTRDALARSERFRPQPAPGFSSIRDILSQTKWGVQ